MIAICEKYAKLYFAWVTADEFEREEVYQKMRKHHFYCNVCQDRHKELTQQASQAQHPELIEESHDNQ